MKCTSDYTHVIQIIETDKDAKLGKNLWLGHLIWTNAPKLNGTKGDYKFSIGDIVESGSHECTFIDQCLDQ